jgi:hypothetical protein
MRIKVVEFQPLAKALMRRMPAVTSLPTIATAAL